MKMCETFSLFFCLEKEKVTNKEIKGFRAHLLYLNKICIYGLLHIISNIMIVNLSVPTSEQI